MNFLKQLKNNFFLLSQVWKACPMRVILEFIGVFINLSATIGTRVVLVKLILDMLSQKRSFFDIALLIFITAMIELLNACFNSWMGQYYRPKSAIVISLYFKKKIYDHAVNMDYVCYDNKEFYNQYMLAIKESDNRAVTCLSDLCNFISSVLQIILYGGLIIISEPSLMLLAVLPAIFYGIAGSKLSEIKVERTKQTTPLERRQAYFNQAFYETKYAKEIRSTSIGKILLHHFEQNTSKMIQVIKKVSRRSIPYGLIQSSIFYGQYIGIIGYLAMRALVFRNISIGDFSLLMNSAIYLSENWRFFGYICGVVVEHGLFAKNYIDFIQLKPTIKIEKPISSIPLKREELNLKLSNVVFQYERQKNKLLYGITLSIPSGSKIALVGPNGAGKSTLVKLLLRLYDPTEGEILLDEVSIKSFEPTEYRKIFGVVFQDFQTYAISIAENILLKKLESEKEREIVEKSLEIAGLLEKVKSLPKGIETKISKEFEEDGVVFSGGELQKLAIARAVAQDPKILILDEPSSALDPIMEYEINQALLRAMRDRTVILISHRLSTVCDVDKIYLINHGVIEEQGSHDELLKKNGTYARMFLLQASQY